ncbi:glucose 1-dehydrogenase [Rhizobium sp. WYCCWR 11152]|uniref:SDR family NAD(P)-dependent oxidoreductase n=1 Tax=unclassified Rhizobium TaxID=2613769 RepID=UPI00149298BA|nr:MULTISPECIES: glucose 1-dehydrogenase [unclassified Rhizobium]MBA1349977.1 glucose 1-dehydrogenase [Rhizobium sp. WYCCWR 11146]NNU68023.1 glucose 1-dehydrogenase [Rhizobium sp. WYCCWR 11152]
MYAEKFRLDGKVAVVTGGGRGIGLSCVEALAEHGAKVVIADIDKAIADEGAAAMKAKGYDVATYQVDVTKSAEVDRLADWVVSTYGKVDILVANAGIARSGVAAEDVTDEHWLHVNDVNYNGVFWCNRAFARHMLNAHSGSIVNIGSMSGLISNRPQKQTYYNAAKAAVHQMTSSLAAEWADRGIRVNAVAPTYIETAMTTYRHDNEGMIDVWLRDTPMHRLGKPDEIASVVHFLASDASSLMTGTTVVADAGFTCW